jgi:hypothetical protein
MKNILLFLALASTVVFTSCEGDPGPPGQDGGLVYAQVFEVNVNSYQYHAANNTLFSSFYGYPFTVYESDVVLAYRYEGQDDIGNGETADIWTQLPQNIFYNDGTGDFFQYNFNNTFVDVQFTIEGNFDLTNIDPIHDTNQIFRIAVVPAEFAKTNPSMEDVLEVMRTNDNLIEKIEK